jgi:hypothetical protein
VKDFSDDQKETVFFEGKKIVVKSGAGSGKTTILKGYANQNIHLPFLYLCYNSAIQQEASSSFPKNVTCRTGHAIAMGIDGEPLRHKLVDNLRLTDVKNFIKANDWELTKDVVRGLNNFLNSSRPEISLHDINFKSNFSSREQKRNLLILKCIKSIWDAAIDPEHTFPVTHDIYLKKFCMREPMMHRWFAGILFDEVQDANPVIADWVFKQDKCKHILVGDDHQQLYRWRGAENFMDSYAEKTKCKVVLMPQSYRFGNKTAEIASRLLQYKSKITKCAPFPIKGNGNIDDLVYKLSPTLFNNSHRAILHRTVMATIATAIKYIDKKIFWVGKISSYSLDSLLDVFYLKHNQKDKIKNKKLLVEHKKYSSYTSMAEDTQDTEMKRVVSLIEKYGNSIPGKIAALKRNSVKDERFADLTISTAHRSKGLEWDNVELADDFPDLLDKDKGYKASYVGDEINLIYVASTRAMKVLKVNSIVEAIFVKMGGSDSIFSVDGPTPEEITRSDDAGTFSGIIKMNQR